MIVLDASTKTLQITVTANADVTISGYRDATDPPSFSYEYAVTAGGNPNTISPAGSATAPLNIDHITIKTTGGANTYVVQQYNSSGAVTTSQPQGVLAANETGEWIHSYGWKTLDASSQQKMTSVAAAGTLTGTTLAANVVTSSLTTVGALNAGSITSGFGSIDIGTDALTAGAISASGLIKAGDAATFFETASGATAVSNFGRNIRFDGANFVRTVADNDVVLIQFDAFGGFAIYAATDGGTTVGSTITLASRFSMTSAGVITVPGLAGSGSRTVVASSTGVLSAP